MYGSTFSDTVSSEVSLEIEIDIIANITESSCPVLMQTYISRIGLTTAQSRVVPGLKVVKGLNGRMRCYGIGWCMNHRFIFVHSVPKESTSIRDRIFFKGIIPLWIKSITVLTFSLYRHVHKQHRNMTNDPRLREVLAQRPERGSARRLRVLGP